MWIKGDEDSVGEYCFAMHQPGKVASQMFQHIDNTKIYCTDEKMSAV